MTRVMRVTNEGKRPAEATHQRVLELRQTINPATRKHYTLKELGDLWGISTARVGQLAKRAMELQRQGKIKKGG